jgi:hypothetical protein
VKTPFSKPKPDPVVKAGAKAPARPVVAKPVVAKPVAAKPVVAKALTEGQRAYEAKRAAKAGMSLDRWLTSKQRAQEAEAREREKAAEQAKPPKKPGFFGRLMDRAHKPL